MARRKKGDDTAIVYLIAIAVALSALAIVTPIALFGWWIVSESRNIKYSLRGPVGPSPEEQHVLILCQTQIDENNGQISKLEQSGAGLMRRTDGMFDGRDTFGRELNSKIQSLQEFRDSVLIEKNNVEYQISERFSEWVVVRNRTIGLRLSLLTYILVSFFTFASRPDWLQPLGHLAGFYLGEKDFTAQMVVGASLIGSILALIVLFVGTQGYQKKLVSKRELLQMP
jgi:hypothetical protein